MTRFILYLLRWQASTLILYPVIREFGASWQGVIIANLIGGVFFFGIDRWILNGGQTPSDSR